MMTQNGDQCIKLFSALSRVRKLSWILSRLNILCTTLVKPQYTKIVIHPLFTVDMLRRLHANVKTVCNKRVKEQSLARDKDYQERSVRSQYSGQDQAVKQVEVKVDNPAWRWYSTYSNHHGTTSSHTCHTYDFNAHMPICYTK